MANSESLPTPAPLLLVTTISRLVVKFSIIQEWARSHNSQLANWKPQGVRNKGLPSTSPQVSLGSFASSSLAKMVIILACAMTKKKVQGDN